MCSSSGFKVLHVVHKLCLRGGSIIGGPTKNIMVNLIRPIELWKNIGNISKNVFINFIGEYITVFYRI
jgi:hypothetical protein